MKSVFYLLKVFKYGGFEDLGVNFSCLRLFYRFKFSCFYVFGGFLFVFWDVVSGLFFLVVIFSLVGL